MSIFKAYDIRGVFPSEINGDIVYKIGRALVSFLGVKEVVVGRDMRNSGDELFSAFSKGVTDQGANVVDIGMCTTDMLYFGVAHYSHAAGAMITASHNPKEYNGLKMTRAGAMPIGQDSGLTDIQKMVEEAHFANVDDAEKGEVISKDIRGDFIRFVLDIIDLDAIKPLRVLVDGGNGMAGHIVPSLFERLPIEMTEMCLTPDGDFPDHEPNPLVEENREKIVTEVKSNPGKYDLGIAFDGDCDRCFFIDEKGEFIPGDFVLALFSKNVLQKHSGGKVIYDVRSSWAVRDTVEKLGGVAVPCRVGHAFIKHKLKNEGAALGGEVSGHYYFTDFFGVDSGVTAALVMLELVSFHGSLSQLVSEFSSYHVSGEINLKVDDKDAAIKRVKQTYADAKLSSLDGISVEYTDWHCNVRKSNTEPFLRLNLEAFSLPLMEEKRDEVLAVMGGEK